MAPTEKQIAFALHLQMLYQGDNPNINKQHTADDLKSKRRRYVTAYIDTLSRAVDVVTASKAQVDWALDLQAFLDANAAEILGYDATRYAPKPAAQLAQMPTHLIYRHIDTLLAIKNTVHANRGEYSKVFKRRT